MAEFADITVQLTETLKGEDGARRVAKAVSEVKKEFDKLDKGVPRTSQTLTKTLNRMNSTVNILGNSFNRILKDVDRIRRKDFTNLEDLNNVAKRMERSMKRVSDVSAGLAQRFGSIQRLNVFDPKLMEEYSGKLKRTLSDATKLVGVVENARLKAGSIGAQLQLAARDASDKTVKKKTTAPVKELGDVTNLGLRVRGLGPEFKALVADDLERVAKDQLKSITPLIKEIEKVQKALDGIMNVKDTSTAGTRLEQVRSLNKGLRESDVNLKSLEGQVKSLDKFSEGFLNSAKKLKAANTSNNADVNTLAGSYEELGKALKEMAKRGRLASQIQTELVDSAGALNTIVQQQKKASAEAEKSAVHAQRLAGDASATTTRAASQASTGLGSTTNTGGRLLSFKEAANEAESAKNLSNAIRTTTAEYKLLKQEGADVSRVQSKLNSLLDQAREKHDGLAGSVERNQAEVNKLSASQQGLRGTQKNLAEETDNLSRSFINLVKARSEANRALGIGGGGGSGGGGGGSRGPFGGIPPIVPPDGGAAINPEEVSRVTRDITRQIGRDLASLDLDKALGRLSTERVMAFGQSLEIAQQQIANVEGAIKGLAKAEKDGLITKEQYSKAVNKLTADVTGLERGITRGSNGFTRFGRHLATSRVGFSNFIGTIGRANIAMASMTAGINGMGAAMSAIGIFAFAAGITKTAIDMDNLEATLRASFGTAEQVSDEFSFLERTANKLGVSFVGLAHPYSRLTVAARSVGFATENVRTLFESLTVASAAFGLRLEETRGIVRAFEQMLSKGVVQYEEVKNQLGDRLPGAVAIFAKAFAVSKGEIEETSRVTQKHMADFAKAMEQGLVPSAQVIPIVARLLKKDLAEAAAVMASKVRAEFNRLHNDFVKFSRELFKLGLEDALISIASTARDVLGSGFIREAIVSVTGSFASLTKNIEENLEAWSRLAVAISGLFVGSIAARGLQALAGIFSNPLVAAAVALTAVLFEIPQAVLLGTDSLKNFSDVMEDVTDAVKIAAAAFIGLTIGRLAPFIVSITETVAIIGSMVLRTKSLAGAVAVLGAAFEGVGASLAINPATAWITAIASLVALMLLWKSRNQEVIDSLVDIQDEITLVRDRLVEIGEVNPRLDPSLGLDSTEISKVSKELETLKQKMEEAVAKANKIQEDAKRRGPIGQAFNDFINNPFALFATPLGGAGPLQERFNRQRVIDEAANARSAFGEATVAKNRAEKEAARQERVKALQADLNEAFSLGLVSEQEKLNWSEEFWSAMFDKKTAARELESSFQDIRDKLNDERSRLAKDTSAFINPLREARKGIDINRQSKEIQDLEELRDLRKKATEEGLPAAKQRTDNAQRALEQFDSSRASRALNAEGTRLKLVEAVGLAKEKELALQREIAGSAKDEAIFARIIAEENNKNLDNIKRGIEQQTARTAALSSGVIPREAELDAAQQNAYQQTRSALDDILANTDFKGDLSKWSRLNEEFEGLALNSGKAARGAIIAQREFEAYNEILGIQFDTFKVGKSELEQYRIELDKLELIGEKTPEEVEFLFNEKVIELATKRALEHKEALEDLQLEIDSIGVAQDKAAIAQLRLNLLRKDGVTTIEELDEATRQYFNTASKGLSIQKLTNDAAQIISDYLPATVQLEEKRNMVQKASGQILSVLKKKFEGVLTPMEIMNAHAEVMAKIGRDVNSEWAEMEATLADLEDRRDAIAGLERAALKYKMTIMDVATTVENIFVSAIESIEDVLVEFFYSGELDLNNFIEQIHKQILRATVQKVIIEPILDLILGDLAGAKGPPGTKSDPLYVVPLKEPVNTTPGGTTGGSVIDKILDFFGLGEKKGPAPTPTEYPPIPGEEGRPKHPGGAPTETSFIDDALSFFDGIFEDLGTGLDDIFTEGLSLVSSIFGGGSGGGGLGEIASLVGSFFGGGSGTSSSGGGDSLGTYVQLASLFLRNGGVVGPRGMIPLQRYASGGIATDPTLAMFGEGSQNEAFVPLPDGRSIPVNLGGDGGNKGNTIINMRVVANDPNTFRKSMPNILADAHRASMVQNRRNN